MLGHFRPVCVNRIGMISKPRHAIDRIVVAAPSDWNGVLAVLKEAPR